jgi:hypothetical protein
MLRILASAMLVCFLSACASGPQLNSGPVRIASAELGQYWILGEKGKRGGRLIRGAGNDLGCAEMISSFDQVVANPDDFVTFEYLIDSNGERFDEQVVEQSGGEFMQIMGEGISAFGAQIALPAQDEWLPAASNFMLTPVIVRETIYLKSGTAACEAQS